MKKITLITFLLFSIYFNSNAQLVLDFNTHAPIAGDVAHFFEVNFMEPGDGGKDIIWDYSVFQPTEKTINSLHENTPRAFIDYFSINPNILLTEDDKQHFFIVTPRSNQLVGTITDQYQLKYETPITKMTYPFTYNDYITGVVNGDATYSNDYHIELTGYHYVEADAYGLMILPDNRIKNVLRVKQFTHTTQVSMCGIAEVDNYKYSWYAADERYPLVSTIIREERSSTGNNKLIQETYVNERIYTCNGDNNLISDINDNSNNSFNYTVYPNPFRNDINISYQLNDEFEVNIGIYDILGKKVKDLVLNESQTQGVYSYTVGANEIGLNPGLYFVKFEIGNQVFVEKINRTH
ncbi:MAG: T9SS type A sorting domain-containing protein [Bacteroidales bacterium]|nr:T9SS type A sorting domain-containing protein [Bacteroidales bacterium]